MSSGNVEICVERTNKDCLPRLRQWLPVIDKFSGIFGIRIVADMPNGQQDFMRIEDTLPTVYLHIHAFPDRSSMTIESVKPESIFGFSPPAGHSFRQVKYGPTVGYMGHSVPVGDLIVRSPEGNILGIINDRNFYIFPGVLSGWKKSEDFRILSQILYWNIIDAFLYRNHSALTEAVRHNLGEKFKNLNLSLIRRFRTRKIKKLKSSIQSFFENYTMSCLEKLSEQQCKAFSEVSAKRKEHFQKLVSVCELEDALELALNRSKSRDFAQEFEKILAMENVLSVRVNNNENIPKIVIFTGDIIQGPIVNSYYDIGSFEIEIPAIPKKAGIRFYQSRNPGKFKHKHATSSTDVCFGNGINGLNIDMDRLAANFDIAPLVHLMLTFLAKETSLPEARSSLERRPKNLFPPAPVYANEEDKKSEKESFIKVMESIVVNINTSELESRLNRERAEAVKLQEDREKLRLILLDLEAAIRAAELRLGKEAEFAGNQINALILREDILSIIVNEDEIQIHFDAYGPYANSPKKMCGAILRVRKYEPLQVFYGSDNSFVYDSDLLTSGMIRGSSEAALVRQQLSGNISELVEAVKNEIVESCRKATEGEGSDV